MKEQIEKIIFDFAGNPYLSACAICKIMDEYAKQQAMEFVDWIQDNDWMYFDKDDYRRINTRYEIIKTFSELYQLFLKDQ